MLIDGNASAWTPGLAGTAKIMKGKHMPDSPRPRSAFVPHNLAAPIAGVVSGPLAGLMAVVKDMYDSQGERTGRPVAGGTIGMVGAEPVQDGRWQGARGDGGH